MRRKWKHVVMMGECEGMAWAQLQATAKMLAAEMGIGEDVDDKLREMIADGKFKKCSKHPDHYILPEWRDC